MHDATYLKKDLENPPKNNIEYIETCPSID